MEKDKQIIKEFIDEHGSATILDEINTLDIIDYLDDWMISMIDDEDLIDGISDPYTVLDKIPLYEIKNYLLEKYKGSETDEILIKIKEICRELQPKGYIDKEDAKKLLCDYLDFWMNRSF